MLSGKKRNLIILCCAFIVAVLITGSISYAMYKSQTPTSGNNFSMEIFVPEDATLTSNNCAVNDANYDVYVRAYIYTYWTLTPNNQNNELVAKDTWTVPSNYINSTDWTKVGNFYYYNTILAKDQTAKYLVNDSIKTSLQVIYDDTESIAAIQSYRIVYEYVYAFKNETSNSSLEAWNVIIENNTVVTG